MSHTLAEIAEITGKSQAVLRKHIERGKLAVSKDGNRILVEDEALEAYQASDIFEEASVASQTKNGWEVGNIIARLPTRFLNAILDGIPTAKKAGSPTAWEAATIDVPKRPTPVKDGDPHWGFKVGHQHNDEPRWARSNSNTWRLGDATFTWDPEMKAWVGGGVRSGVYLHDDLEGEGNISPANPATHFRPLAPPGAVPTRPKKDDAKK